MPQIYIEEVIVIAVQFEKTGVVNASGETVNPNLLTNTDFSQTYQQTTGWDTTKNGTTLANSWGGYNSGVTNASTVYHAHLTSFQGETVYAYIRTADESWLGISQGGLQSKLVANTTYTWSLDQYMIGNNFCTAGVYFYKLGGTSAGFHAGCPGYATELNKWVRCVYTFTLPSDIDLSKNVSMYIYGHNGDGNKQGTVYMKRPKLEIGSVATPWCPAESEGYVETNHGFVGLQSNGNAKIYDDLVQGYDFIEW